jgi:hypothetical protein
MQNDVILVFSQSNTLIIFTRLQEILDYGVCLLYKKIRK